MPLTHPLVLMYHGIVARRQDIPPYREAGADLYDVSIENFKRQLQEIKSRGLSVGTFNNSNLPVPKIVLTFDDGEMNNFSEAFPVLHQFGYLAYFFITASRIGKKGYVDWLQLQTLKQVGMIIGSHSLNHRRLTSLSESEIREELVASKEILENGLQAAITDFSVPRGFYNQLILDIALATGYKKIFVSDLSKQTEGLVLARTAVKHNWTPQRFSQALLGHTPPDERFFHCLKNVSKSLCGERLYDFIRSGLIPKSR